MNCSDVRHAFRTEPVFAQHVPFQLSSELQLKRTRFVGEVAGQAKAQTYFQSDLYVLPGSVETHARHICNIKELSGRGFREYMIKMLGSRRGIQRICYYIKVLGSKRGIQRICYKGCRFQERDSENIP